jgi:hypothetical protein
MPEPARIQSDWGELRAARDEPQRARPELVEGACHLQSRSLALKSDVRGQPPAGFWPGFSVFSGTSLELWRVSPVRLPE